MRTRLLALLASLSVLGTVTAVPAYAASWHTFWSAEWVDTASQGGCSPSLSSSHPWKTLVSYLPDNDSRNARIDIARFNDTNGTYAAWERGPGSYWTSSGYLPTNGTRERTCARTLPGSFNDGDVYIAAEWYG